MIVFDITNVSCGGLMDGDINFLDVILISRVDNETTLENYGGKINTSFFEAANLMGLLKVKGLVMFEQSIGGKSPVKLTDKAVTVLNLMKERSEEGITNLDKAILNAIADGATNHIAIESVVNVASFDVALHLYKLYTTSKIEYTISSGKLTIRLTEKGYSGISTKRDLGKKEEIKTEDVEQEISLPEEQSPPTEEDFKQKMRQSKMEFYIQKYGLIFLVFVIILFLISAAAVLLLFFI